MQKEVLLRDIFEYVPAWTYTFLALFLVIASELAFAIPVVAYTLAALFILRAMYLFALGRKVKRYQKNLTQLAVYKMRAKDLPISNNVQFLGMGFEWNALHAQRVYDLNLPKNRKYRALPESYKWIRRFEVKYEHTRWLKPVIVFTQSESKFNPWTPVPPLEGEAYLHAVGLYEKEEPLLQSLSNRVGHMLVLGTTRVGKTRFAEVIISQDIARGDVVIVMDPKGDADLLLRCYTEAKRAGREDSFYLFHLGYPDISAQYNPVGSFMRITEVATRIASQMPGEGQSAAFKEFVWGYVNQVSKGLVGIGKTPSFPLIKMYSQNLEPLYIEFMDKLLSDRLSSYDKTVQEYIDKLNLKPDERRAVGITEDISQIKRDRAAIARYLLFKHNIDKIVLTANEADIAQSLTKAFLTDQQYLSKLVASLDPFLEKMTTGSVAELISPSFQDPHKDVFDWGSVIQSGGIVYVGLDALSDQEVARTVGASMLADLTSQYGRIYKEGRSQGLPNLPGTDKDRPIRVHIDEANEPADKTLIPSLNKAGGAGVSVTLYTQTSSDFEARLGNKAFANQMFGNFNTIVSFRVQDEDTAKIFTQKQRQVNVIDIATFSGANDSSDPSSDVDFTSSTQSRVVQDKVPLISTEDLTRLPKGHFYVMMDGNKLFKGRVPWLQRDDSDVPGDIRIVAAGMRKSYQSTVPDWYSYQDYFDPIQTINAGEKYDAMSDLKRSFAQTWTDDFGMELNQLNSGIE